MRQRGRNLGNHAEHDLGRFPDGKAADRVAVKTNVDESARATLAQHGVIPCAPEKKAEKEKK